MNILGQVTSCTSWQINVLTDGHLACSYQEIPEVFERLQKHFAERGIGLKDCLALECLNSVPSALVLLYLLEKGYSFLLLPRTVNTSQELGKMASIPRFCRYRITTENFADNGSTVDLKHPQQFLDLVENKGWVDDSEGLKNASPKLYLRTSGSTGCPKMALHLHTKLLGNALNCAERLRLESEDRIAIPVPIFHMYGLGAAFLPGVAVGASIDLQKGANLLRYLQREKEFVPNVAFMTPAFCETLLKGRRSPRAYKLTVAAGDRIREDTFTKFESFFGCLVKLYGSTEMGAIAASNPDEPREVRTQTVGIPMSGVQMRVEEGELEAGDGMEGVGELWCQHKYGFEGYVDGNGKSVEETSQDNWFCTKDLGRIRRDGCVEVLGRCDHSVNRNGLLVFLADVEKAIETIEAIEQVVVVAKGESQRGKGLMAYCVLAQGSQITATDIRAACFDILPRHGIPDLISIVSSLPLLPNGKVDRQKLISKVDQVNDSK
jgi:acyl-CoA synthetase (AMP-forming)/AMP-acid ligase II